jgi:hypothetical protein
LGRSTGSSDFGSRYFVSQGAGKLFWPLFAGFLRMAVAIAGGWLVLRLTGPPAWLFAAVALGLLLHGLIVFAAILSGLASKRSCHEKPA